MVIDVAFIAETAVRCIVFLINIITALKHGVQRRMISVVIFFVFLR